MFGRCLATAILFGMRWVASAIMSTPATEATRTIAGKWDGKAPTTVSLWWLPSGVGDFLTRMMSAPK